MLERDECWRDLREVSVSAPQPTSAERIVDHVRSMSWVAAMADGERAEALLRVEEMLGRAEIHEARVEVTAGIAELA